MPGTPCLDMFITAAAEAFECSSVCGHQWDFNVMFVVSACVRFPAHSLIS